MIARITGTIIETGEKFLVVETAGLGYMVFTPSLPGTLGDVVTLHTHMVIRDDAHELYGFERVEEKILFSTLISVSGVGPRTALHMLALYPISEIVRAIKNGDAKAISLVPGIGKKTAEKVIIDLKDKLAAFEMADDEPKSDLVEALLSLGYKDTAVRTVITLVDTTLPLPKQIAEALRHIGK